MRASTRAALLPVGGLPPAGLSRQEALEGLLASKCYSGQPVALAPLDVDLLSLPAAGAEPTAVASLVGEEGAALVKWLLENKVLPEEVAAERLRRSKVAKPYMDPGVARSKQKYAELLLRLDSAGMLVWKTSGRPSCSLSGKRV